MKAALLLALVYRFADAQTLLTPVPPYLAKTNEDCEEFSNKFQRVLDAAEDQLSACFREKGTSGPQVSAGACCAEWAGNSAFAFGTCQYASSCVEHASRKYCLMNQRAKEVKACYERVELYQRSNGSNQKDTESYRKKADVAQEAADILLRNRGQRGGVSSGVAGRVAGTALDFVDRVNTDSLQKLDASLGSVTSQLESQQQVLIERERRRQQELQEEREAEQRAVIERYRLWQLQQQGATNSTSDRRPGTSSTSSSGSSSSNQPNRERERLLERLRRQEDEAFQDAASAGNQLLSCMQSGATCTSERARSDEASARYKAARDAYRSASRSGPGCPPDMPNCGIR